MELKIGKIYETNNTDVVKIIAKEEAGDFAEQLTYIAIRKNAVFRYDETGNQIGPCAHIDYKIIREL